MKKLTPSQQRALEALPPGQWVSAIDVNLKPMVLRNLVKRGEVKMKPCYESSINSTKHTDGFVYMRKQP